MQSGVNFIFQANSTNLFIAQDQFQNGFTLSKTLKNKNTLTSTDLNA